MNIRSIIIVSVLIGATSQAQFAYPSEDFLGGGIGYSPMYIQMESIPGEEKMADLGLSGGFGKDPLIVHGGEGFAHMTGRWRIGGYAGIGSKSISTIPDIILYINRDGEDGYQAAQDLSNIQANEDTIGYYTDIYNPSIEAKFTFSLGAASVEYVMPIFQDLELSGGALLGLGRASLSIEQTIGNPKWDATFSNVYGVIDNDILYYEVDSLELGADILPSIQLPGLLRNMTGTFFNFQPYIAIKWQFLDRLGIRISTGYNQGTITAGSWKLNGGTKISDSPLSSIEGLTFRTMLYMGL